MYNPRRTFTDAGGHKVYECMTNNTIRSFAFSVTPRPQPPDYVYTPTEKLTLEGLVQRGFMLMAQQEHKVDC